MKLITLASGRGERVQEGDYSPKALKIVSGKALIKWSVDSFHTLISRGALTQADLCFVVLHSDVVGHQIDEEFKNIFGPNINIIVLENLTSGPAESGERALESLKERNLISEDEVIIFNDCDHYFQMPSIARQIAGLLESDQFQVQLFGARKEIDDLEWSVVKTDGEFVTSICEKPNIQQAQEYELKFGVIGVYIFRNSRLFSSGYSKLVNQQGEKYISHVVAILLKTPSIKCRISHTQKFYSLGTNSKIRENAGFIGESKQLLDAGSLFVDLDGTLFEHDSGFFSDSGEYSNELVPISLENINFLNLLWDEGHQVVLTTSRPKSFQGKLEEMLKSIGLRYDHLVTGLGGGPRMLINDLKPSLPGIQMALASNVLRNESDLNGALSAFQENFETEVIHEFAGESGERSVRVRRNGNDFVRKISQESQNSKNILEYQVNWFKTVSLILPNHVPIISQFQNQPENQVHFFESQYIPGVQPAGRFIFSGSQQIGEERLNRVIDTLGLLYERTLEKSSGNSQHLISIMHKKALPGYRTAIQGFGTDENGYVRGIKVNGEPIRNLDEKLTKNFQPPLIFWQDLLESELENRSLIHGDPTLSNLVSDSEGKVILLDPIGTRVMPDFQFKGHLGTANPMFDYSRIRLSIEAEYERWSDDLIVIDGERGEKDVMFSRNELADLLNNHLSSYWPKELSGKTDLVNELYYLSTLCRIVPYKMKSKPKEAIFMLKLIEKQWERMLAMDRAINV
jgi:choline kinase